MRGRPLKYALRLLISLLIAFPDAAVLTTTPTIEAVIFRLMLFSGFRTFLGEHW
jgi:hypothetical protein